MVQKLIQEAVSALKAQDFNKTKSLLKDILQKDPRNLTALHISGIVLNETGEHNAAIQALEKHLKFNRTNPGVYILLAEILVKEKLYDQLITLIEPTLSSFPAEVSLLNSLAVAYTSQKKNKEAEKLLLQSLNLNPHQADVYNLLGLNCSEMKLNHKAIQIYKMGLEINPDHGTLHTNIALAYLQIGYSREAIKSLEIALTKNPIEEHAAIHHGLIFAKQHDLHVKNEEFLEHAKIAYDLAFKHIPKNHPERNPKLDEPGYKIRLGYVSGDFHQHPVGDFMVSIVQNHNKDAFEIFCYDNKGTRDHVNELTRASAFAFRDIAKLSDDEVVKLIQEDQIDILVDLSGITDFNRLRVFAAKPCYRQIMWIGYFGTLAMPEMDYLVGDHNTFEPGDENFYLEKTYKLPYSYLPGDPYGIDQEIRDVPCKRNGYVTFGAFNKMLKITPDVMAVWARILQGAPTAKLFFKNTCLGDPQTRQMIIDFFTAQGIAAERIILESFSPRKEFLDKYNEVDISLDSFPYGGGVTTVESLHMGVPVITWHGDRWMCRASSSYLRVLGHEELIAKDFDEYVEKAIELSKDLPRLESYRSGLRPAIKNSEINASNFVKHFENGIREMLK